MRTCLACCAFAVAAVALPAQATHLVGPGGFAEIRDALAVAAPGDRLHVQPGTYAHFTATVGCTIRALVPGSVFVEYSVAFLPPGCSTSLSCLQNEGSTRLVPPPGQTVHVVGVHFVGNEVPSGAFVPYRHRVVVGSGSASFDQCELHARGMAALTVNDARVHLQSCIVSVVPPSAALGGVGIQGNHCDITAIDTTITGGLSTGLSLPGGHGVWLTNATLHGSNLVIQSGGVSFPLPNPGFAVLGDGALFLSDSQLHGGCPIQWTGSARELVRCTLTGTNTNCATVAPSPQPLLGITRPAPLTPGALFTLQFHGEPNGLVAIFASGGPGRLDLPTLLVQPLWLDSTMAFLHDFAVADAQGLATAGWLIPTGPGIADQQLWFQGLSGFTLPLQTSAPAGGIAR